MKSRFLSVYRDIILQPLKIFSLFLFVFLMILASGCSDKTYVSYEFASYLSGNSAFEENVATILPSKDELNDAVVVYYLTYDNEKTAEAFAQKMLCLTVEYKEEQFAKATQHIKEKALLHKDETTSKSFFYNGVLYNGFIFNNNGYCAIAYHICFESKTISYIAFDCMDLQFMDVESALRLFPEFNCKNQIVSY